MVAQSRAVSKKEAEEVEVIPTDVIKDITSWEDAQAYFAQEEIEVSVGLEVSDGFERYGEEDKPSLVGTPFIILDWRRLSGDMGMFATVRVLTRDGKRIRFSDGSSGVYQQLLQIEIEREKKGHKALSQGVLVRKGLRASEYYVYKDSREVIPKDLVDTVPKEQKLKANTYYLDF